MVEDLGPGLARAREAGWAPGKKSQSSNASNEAEAAKGRARLASLSEANVDAVSAYENDPLALRRERDERTAERDGALLKIQELESAVSGLKAERGSLVKHVGEIDHWRFESKRLAKLLGQEPRPYVAGQE